MDTQNSLPLIKFWLDADSFKLATASELAATSSNPGTPPMTEKRKVRTELCEFYRDNDKSVTPHQLLPTQKKTISKSVSLDACHHGSSLDNEHSPHSSIDNCSLTELYEDDESGCMAPNASIRCSNLINEKIPSNHDHHNKSMTNKNNNITDNISDMGKPLTDDEKSQLCEQNQLKQNLKLKNDAETMTTDGSNHKTSTNLLNTSDDGKYSPILKQKNCFQSSVTSDAIRIFKKYLTTKSSHYIDMPATIISKISLAIGENASTINIEAGDDNLSSNILPPSIEQLFIEAQDYVLETLKNRYLSKFIESSFYCKYCVDILTGETLQIQDIMYCESALFYFMEFLEQENEQHYLEFWVTAINFRKLLDESEDAVLSTSENPCDSINQLQNDALILYEKYFSLQATCSLKMSDRIRFGIEENICTTDKSAIQHCFDTALRIIERYLEQKYFRQFLTSNLFYKYLSELLQKIDANVINGECSAARGLTRTVSMGAKPITNRHRKTFSDCTYEKTVEYQQNSNTQQPSAYISTQNTLLAMDTTSIKPKKMPSTSASSDMQIDSRQLYNPDLLWCRRRPNSVDCGLSFGRVDALGRYERDFDMEPITAAGGTDHKSIIATKSSKIRQVVRKLVNMPEDRTQEEIAWKMAEIIVKDITNITLNSHSCNKTNKNSDNDA